MATLPGGAQLGEARIKDGRGRSAREELNSLQLDVVKEFKYLGVILTSNMSFKKHAKLKLKDSKAALNSTFNLILGKRQVNNSLKYKVFLATARAIMWYAAQVWGHMELNEVNQLLRFFIKKNFSIIIVHPDYAIHLESGLSSIYLHTQPAAIVHQQSHANVM